MLFLLPVSVFIGSALTVDYRAQIDSPEHCCVIPKSDSRQVFTASAGVTWLFQVLLVGSNPSQGGSLMSGGFFVFLWKGG